MLDQQPNAGRVGLVTITGDSNFGNRLQNYAMQRIISELGFSCSTILNTPCAAAEFTKRGAQRLAQTDTYLAETKGCWIYQTAVGRHREGSTVQRELRLRARARLRCRRVGSGVVRV